MTNLKQYPLQIKTLHDLDNGSTCTYWSKGHHDKAAFISAVKEANEVEYPVTRVRHDWCRWEIWSSCPSDTGTGEAWTHCLHPAKQGTRGTFAVTLLDL